LLAPNTKTEDTLMLRVLVELVPDFGGDARRELACAEIHGARIAGMVGDYSLVVREGPNPLADTQPWTAAGDILGHDRAQTVWALAEKVCMFAMMAASHQGPVSDLVKIVRPESLRKSVAERVRQIAAGGDPLVAELAKDLKGCPRCDAVMGPQWRFCAICGERGNE
jgi:hypothetical protein